jgi:hypothetical protein
MATTTRDVNAADYRAEAERLRQRAQTATDIAVQSHFIAQADRCEELAVAIEIIARKYRLNHFSPTASASRH